MFISKKSDITRVNIIHNDKAQYTKNTKNIQQSQNGHIIQSSKLNEITNGKRNAPINMNKPTRVDLVVVQAPSMSLTNKPLNNINNNNNNNTNVKKTTTNGATPTNKHGANSNNNSNLQQK